ncbi:MAG TPA: hypothetical protein VFC78_24160 [Tepidisphaeraceae bacterium]|nr:hypothetical protein [Tepidisphaeraceae bacterium]
MPRVLAYLITWGTYGTRLHGDKRGTVDRANNEYGQPILRSDPQRLQEERDRLKFPPIVLTAQQCGFAEDAIPSICEQGRWSLHARAAAPDHVHVVLTSPFDPTTIRRLLKRWLGQSLSGKWPLADARTWWAEGGSIKWIHDEDYLHNAIRYVERQRIHQMQ